jgi:hypothetical protein
MRPSRVGFTIFPGEAVVMTKPTAFPDSTVGVCNVAVQIGDSATVKLVTVEMPSGSRLRFGDQVKLEYAASPGGVTVYHIRGVSIPSPSE